MVLFTDSPVNGLSTVWADYTGIYSAECTVSAEHSVGVIGSKETGMYEDVKKTTHFTSLGEACQTPKLL